MKVKGIRNYIKVAANFVSVDEMAGMSGWWNGKLMKLQVDETASWWNGKLAHCQNSEKEN